jgi:hypothetical protein
MAAKGRLAKAAPTVAGELPGDEPPEVWGAETLMGVARLQGPADQAARS